MLCYFTLLWFGNETRKSRDSCLPLEACSGITVNASLLPHFFYIAAGFPVDSPGSSSHPHLRAALWWGAMLANLQTNTAPDCAMVITAGWTAHQTRTRPCCRPALRPISTSLQSLNVQSTENATTVISLANDMNPFIAYFKQVMFSPV